MNQLESWYRTHGPDLLVYLRRFAAGGAAEDLLHETFVQAMRTMQRVADAATPRAWLFGIARHVGLTALRRRRLVEPLPDSVPDARGAEVDPRIEQMRRAIGQLPVEQREPLELRLREGLSYEEIAGVLGIPVGTVRSRLHHAVRRLRERMDTDDGP